MEIDKQNNLSAYEDIKLLLNEARSTVVTQVNNILLKTYWEIGKIIVLDEQNNSDRAEYGASLLKNLSKQLTKEFGRGFSKSNLFNMRRFYLTYQKFQTVSGKLSWSHYSELLSISENKKGLFMKENAKIPIGL
ncbi:DUF1016 N-terminal domain-containing protein [Mycoplasmopsis canis]|uniref:Uncharacterized conserved protein n=1 Tax=Mycoplasmopsis canis TaxID=29555 RepID=A0A449AQ75_9BACT|nr:DUF1016 N-terminal domain-containing protein [Mycoplasmopsis canis]VEU68630.1 Uncharacterized conserved protein [Mycoplasmopsis canis]